MIHDLDLAQLSVSTQDILKKKSKPIGRAGSSAILEADE